MLLRILKTVVSTGVDRRALLEKVGLAVLLLVVRRERSLAPSLGDWTDEPPELREHQATVRSQSTPAVGLGQPTNPTHLSIDVTGWTIMPSIESPTGFSFQITASSMECTGPGASLPPSPFSGCVLPPGGDTGIPPVTGHYSLNPFPGYKINIQVNQLP
jgi:hypothetical protein